MNWREIFTRRTAILMAVAFGTLAVTGCMTPGGDAKEAGAPAAETAAAPVDNRIRVNCQKPVRGSLRRTTEFVGKISVAEPVKVYCKTGGRLETMNFSVGDHVRQGEVMFKLDTEDLQDAVQTAYYNYQSTANSADTSVLNAQRAWDQAAQSYESAKNNMEDLHATYDDLLANLRAQMNNAKSVLDSIDRNTDPAGYASAYNDWVNAKNEYTSTRATYNNLYENYKNQKNNARSSVEYYKETYDNVQTEKGSAQIMMDQAKFNYDRAVRNLNNAVVYAPVSGVITAKNFSVNDSIGTANAVYTISADSDDPVVAFNISEDAANVLSVGSHVTVIYNGGEYDAKIYELSTEANASGLYAAKALPETVLGNGRSGSVVKVRAATAEAVDSLTLKLDYISYDGNQPYVLVYDNGFARRKDLVLGVTTNTDAEIVSGLTENDEVIITWHPNLKEGSELRCDELELRPAVLPAKAEGGEAVKGE